MLKFLQNTLFMTVGVLLAAQVVPGIHYDDGAALSLVVLLMVAFNTFLRPVLILFTLPFVLLTLGIGILIINAFLFLLAGHLVNGFYVDSYWDAWWGSLIISLTHLLANFLFGTRQLRPGSSPHFQFQFRWHRDSWRPPTVPTRKRPPRLEDDETIDV